MNESPFDYKPCDRACKDSGQHNRNCDLRTGDGAPLQAIGGRVYARIDPEIRETLLAIKDRQEVHNLGTEAVIMLRTLRRAYYAGSAIWGIEEADRMTGYAFIRAYERLMFQASPDLQAAIMRGGAHS